MKRVFDNQTALFGPWLMSQVGGQFIPGAGYAIGLWDTERCAPLAATYFDQCNGASVRITLAVPEARNLNREFIWFSFFYPFEQLKVNKIIAPVSSDNLPSVKLTEHFGFKLEATLKDAAPKGDLLIYTMAKDQCEWLSLRNKYRGQTICAAAA